MSSPAADSKSLLHPKPRTGGLRLSRRGRRRTPIIRLGGSRRWRSGGKILLCGLLRRMRVQWLPVQCCRYAKRLRDFYARTVKEIAGGAATVEAVQARILMEAYFSVPIMPVSITNSRW